MFIKYPKIHRLGKDETLGILEGRCYIQEKIDGANTSIWVENNEEMIIKCASRNQIIESGFNGFIDYVKQHEGIFKLLCDHPEYRLYGEWLVRHTIQYNELAYKQFYLFDIMVGDKFLPTWQVVEIAYEYDIRVPQIFDVIDKPTPERLQAFVGQTNLGARGEGIVIKNPDFINQFGEHCYAKLVAPEFTEDNAVVFGGNNKYSELYHEQYVVNKYMTLERVQKVIDKIQPTIDEKLDMKHIPRVLNTVYHDMLTEEIWEIAKKVPSLDFKALQRIAYKKAKQIYVDWLSGDVSVADQNA